MDFKLPTTDCLVCEDFCEGNSQTISEKPLTCFTLHIQSCKKSHPLDNNNNNNNSKVKEMKNKNERHNNNNKAFI